MKKTILGCSIFLMWSTVATSAFAQGLPKLFQITCAYFKLSVPESLNCYTTHDFSGYPNSTDPYPGGTFRMWEAYGKIEGVQYKYVLTEVIGMNEALNPSQTLYDTIKAQLPHAGKATNFSALAHRGGADLMTFKAPNAYSCVGIRRLGPSQTYGHRWILNALLCEPPGKTLSDADIDRFIARATVRGS